jgi:LacI family transcriptional regulator
VRETRARVGSRPKSARATLSDVAQEAGVSVMSVSNFVHGKPVRAETRRRVQEAIERLKYRPNLSARSLRLSEEYSVGIVIADADPAFLNDPFNSRLVSGLSNYLSSVGYTLDVQGVTPEHFETATILTKIGNAALCAILCGPKALRKAHLKNLQGLGQPIVVFQEALPSMGPNMISIRQDDMGGGIMLGEHLSQKKLRSICFVRPVLEWSALELREKGLRFALERGSPGVEVKTLQAPSERFDEVESVIREQLRKEPPDAIVGANDSMAVAALKACEQAGLKVPADILISGFNGFDVWRYTSPTLTTVISPAYEMGRQAGEMLIRRLRKGEPPKRSVVLPVRFQPGESTA